MKLARLFGLRMAEVFEARPAWIDWEQRALRIPADVSKSGREENIPAKQEALLLLKELARAAQLRKSAKEFLIVYTPTGRDREGDAFEPRPIRNARRAWMTALNKHGGGRQWRFHDLRATFVTQIAHVATAATTQSLARHKSPLTTARYTKISDQARRAAVDAMASPSDIGGDPMTAARPPSVRSQSPVDKPTKSARKTKRAA